MSTNIETLGQRLQRLRMAKGLTQSQLAAVAGVPLKSLQNWEIDHREPGLRAACLLAKALGVTAEDLAATTSANGVRKTPRPAGPTKRAEPSAPKSTKPRPKKPKK